MTTTTFFTRLSRVLLFLCISSVAKAQSVGVGTTTPDASAMLDVASNTKGALLPRLSSAQRTAIATPATGLLVYQTDAPAGFYYNAGSPSAPAWTFLNPAATGDNLGNHTATQPLNMGANALTGLGNSIGTSVGLGVRADGGLNIGQNTNGNVLVGFGAGQGTTNGSNNVFSGYQSGFSNTTGSSNVFSGLQSGFSNTSGSSNVYSGYHSGYNSSTGDNNTFSGHESGYKTTSSFNVFYGFRSGYNNSTGFDNEFLGYQSGYSNTTGTQNHFEGSGSGYSNTTGKQNYFSGYASGYYNVAANANHFSGYYSGFSNTTGENNYFSGNKSGYSNTAGNGNAFVGFLSGYNNVTGDNNTALGVQSGPATDALTNTTSLGYKAVATQSNSLILGGTGNNAVNVGIATSAPETRLDVNGNFRLAVRTIPVNINSTYTLVAADIAYSVFKITDGAFAPILVLPAAGTGQVPGQELTIYSTASTACSISGTNTDNATAVALASRNNAGTHGVKYIWDAEYTRWVRLQ